MKGKQLPLVCVIFIKGAGNTFTEIWHTCVSFPMSFPKFGFSNHQGRPIFLILLYKKNIVQEQNYKKITKNIKNLKKT